MKSAADRPGGEPRPLADDERFRRYFDLGLVGMAITAPDYGWLDANDELCEILGYGREELLRSKWTDLTHPEDLAADVARFEGVMAGRSDGYALDKRFLRKDGSIVHATISVKCVRRPDRSPGSRKTSPSASAPRKRCARRTRRRSGGWPSARSNWLPPSTG